MGVVGGHSIESVVFNSSSVVSFAAVPILEEIFYSFLWNLIPCLFLLRCPYSTGFLSTRFPSTRASDLLASWGDSLGFSLTTIICTLIVFCPPLVVSGYDVLHPIPRGAAVHTVY